MNYYSVYSAICGPNCGSHTVISPLNILVTSRCWGQNSVSQRTIEQKFYFIHFFLFCAKIWQSKILNYFLLLFFGQFNHFQPPYKSACTWSVLLYIIIQLTCYSFSLYSICWICNPTTCSIYKGVKLHANGLEMKSLHSKCTFAFLKFIMETMLDIYSATSQCQMQI